MDQTVLGQRGYMAARLCSPCASEWVAVPCALARLARCSCGPALPVRCRAFLRP